MVKGYPWNNSSLAWLSSSHPVGPKTSGEISWQARSFWNNSKAWHAIACLSSVWALEPLTVQMCISDFYAFIPKHHTPSWNCSNCFSFDFIKCYTKQAGKTEPGPIGKVFFNKTVISSEVFQIQDQFLIKKKEILKTRICYYALN